MSKPGIPTNIPFVRARSETPRTEPRRPPPVNTIFICFNCDKPSYYTSDYPELYKIEVKEIEKELEKSYNYNQDKDLGKEEP